MKKLLLGVLGAMLLLMMFLSPVLADNDENFNRAGQDLLTESEEILVLEKADIETFLNYMVEDRVITKEEMLGLRNLLQGFKKTKGQLDSRLKFYGLATSVSLEEALFQMADDYFFHCVRKRDSSQFVRDYFVRRVGEDVLVKSGLAVDRYLIIPLIFLSLFALMFGAAFYNRSDVLFPFGLLGMIVIVALIFIV